MATFKIFKKLQEDQDKLIAIDLLDDDNGSGGGGKPLSTYPLIVPPIVSTLDGTDWTLTNAFQLNSNGLVDFDYETIPALAPYGETVSVGYAKPAYLYGVNNGGTITYGWVFGAEIDISGPVTPPIPLANLTGVPGALILLQALYINQGSGTLTIGVDGYNQGMFINKFQYPGEIGQKVVGNAAVGFDGTDFINYNGFFINGNGINPGQIFDQGAATGLVLPNNESVTCLCYYDDGNPILMPDRRNPQGNADPFALVTVNNNTGADWTRGTDPWNALGLFVGCVQFSDDNYLGSYASEMFFSSLFIVPLPGYQAQFGGSLYWYDGSNWHSFAGGTNGNNTWTGTAGYDFNSLGSGYIPVSADLGGSITPLWKDYNAGQIPVTFPLSGTASSPIQIKLDARHVVSAAVDTGANHISLTVNEFSPLNGQLNSSGYTAGAFSDIDTAFGICGGAKIDNQHFALGYIQQITGKAKMGIFYFDGANIFQTGDIEINTNACDHFKVFYGCNRLDNRSDGNFLAFAGYDTIANQGFIGYVPLNVDFTANAPVFNYIAGLTTSSDWDGFGIDGCGYRETTTGAMLVLKNGNAYYLGIDTGNILIPPLSFPISPTNTIKVKNYDYSHWVVYWVNTTLDSFATILYMDGVNIINTGVVTVGNVNPDRVTSANSYDLVCNSTQSRVVFMSCLENGGVKSFEQILYGVSGGALSVIFDSSTVTALQSSSVKDVCMTAFRYAAYGVDQNVYSIMYIDDQTIGKGSFVLGSNTQTDISDTVRQLPNFNACVGIIKKDGIGMGDPVTVYGPGASIPDAVGAIGLKVYAYPGGANVSENQVTDLYIGTQGQGEFSVVLSKTPSRQTSIYGLGTPKFNTDVFLLTANAALDLPQAPVLYTQPIRMLAKTDFSSVNIPNMNLTEWQGASGSISYPDAYRKSNGFGKKGDILEVTQVFDICETGWYITDRETSPKRTDISLPNAYLYSGTALTPTAPLIEFDVFNIGSVSTPLTIDTIVGMPVGKIFTIIAGSGVTLIFNMQPVVSAGADDMIASGFTVFTLIGRTTNSDYITFQKGENGILTVIDSQNFI